VAYASSNSYFQMALESVRGTPAAGTYTSIPTITPTIDPMVKQLDDDAFRGSPVMIYDAVMGTWHTEVTLKGYVYPDSFPLLLIAALGPDVVTGSSAPYTHTIGLQNAPTTGSQPASCTLNMFDGANAFQIAGAQLADLEITGGADKALEWTAKFIGNPWTTPTPTETWGTESLIAGWSVTTSINSSALAYIQDFTFKIDRKTAPIFTQGLQGPHANFAGPCEVSGTMNAVVDSASDPFSIGGTAYALYRSAALPMVITATSTVNVSTATYHNLALQTSTVQFMDVKRKVDKAYTDLSVAFKAKGNTTDAVAAGFSNVQPTVINAVAAYTAS